MLITSDDVKQQLREQFQMYDDLGPLNYLLGIEVFPFRKGILSLSLSKYINDLIAHLGITNNFMAAPLAALWY